LAGFILSEYFSRSCRRKTCEVIPYTPGFPNWAAEFVKVL
jgi:hypothetical protein